MTDTAAINDLKIEEGLRTTAYKDSEGIWTIGYGRNLQTLTITREQAEQWLIEDYAKAHDHAQVIPEFFDLSPNRRRVLTAMVFQMGLRGVMQFKKARAAMKLEEWDDVCREMLNSKWANQAPARARRYAERMRDDTWPS